MHYNLSQFVLSAADIWSVMRLVQQSSDVFPGPN